MNFNFDFDEWAALAHSDADAFERKRRNAIDDALMRIEGNRTRLEGLQFRIDMERRRARTATKSYLRLSSLMWRSFDAMNEAANGRKPNHASVQSEESAKIIELADRQGADHRNTGHP